jgi:hypothetical protein
VVFMVMACCVEVLHQFVDDGAETGECSTYIVIRQDSAIIWHPFYPLHMRKFFETRLNMAFYLCYKKNKNTQIENGHFVVHIRVSGQQKHLFYKTNTQMHHFRVGPLQCNV